MHCYNNDILPHKAPCVLMATHGYMSERRPSISSHSVALTLLPTLSWSTVLHWPFSSFSSVCANPLSARPYLSPRGYLNTFRPTYTFLSPSFGKLEAPAKWFTLTAKQLVSRPSFISLLWKVHCGSNVISSTVSIYKIRIFTIWFLQVFRVCFSVYSGKWDSDGEREGHAESHPWMDYHYLRDSKNSKRPDTQDKLTKMSKYDKLELVIESDSFLVQSHFTSCTYC